MAVKGNDLAVLSADINDGITAGGQIGSARAMAGDFRDFRVCLL